MYTCIGGSARAAGGRPGRLREEAAAARPRLRAPGGRRLRVKKKRTAAAERPA